ncbi:MAG: hypothetical protein AB8B91_24650 [Rubripirellula sp.]
MQVIGKAKYADLTNDVTGNASALNAFLLYDGEVDTNLLDVKIGVVVPISQRFAFKASYQGLLLDDAAGALEQPNELFLFDSTTQTPHFHKIEREGVQPDLTAIFSHLTLAA